MKNIPKTLLFFCLAFGLTVAFFQPAFQKKSDPPFYFAPSSDIKYFALGFQELYADILWMRLLQNIDFCNSAKGQPIYDGTKKYSCKEGWSYKMTDAITELAPRFLAPYKIAGSIMSVIMGDKMGAKKIYDKALKNFPDNWQIHFSVAYHYLIEMERDEEAIPILIKTADLGGPFWLYALAAKSYRKLGRLLLAQEILKTAIKNNRSSEYRQAFKDRLKEVEEDLEKLKAESSN